MNTALNTQVRTEVSAASFRTSTRLDDKLNGFFVAALIAGVLGMNFGAIEGAAMGRNGDTAAQVMANAKVAAPQAVLVASR